MVEEESDLLGRQPERGFGDSLLMRALSEDTQLPQPAADAAGVPTITVSAEEKLMPASTPRRARDSAANSSRAARATVSLFSSELVVYLSGWWRR